MGAYKHIKELFKKKSKELKPLQKERLIQWRKENAISKIEFPTNLARVRELGYKAKTGYVLARVRLIRGGKTKQRFHSGRRSAHRGRKAMKGKSYQRVAEERAGKFFKNLEVLNSYNVGKDGKHYFFEVILVDPCRPEIINDKKINWICSERGRAERGMTSAGQRGRGLLNKGKGAEKIRPGIRANKKLGK
jgi:large subunit ribosomal protein L15e